VDQETHQRVHQVEAQDLLTLMIQEEEVKAVQESVKLPIG
jgi:hypothetical protein